MTGLLTALTLVFLIIVLFQIGKAAELVSDIRGRSNNWRTESNWNGILLLAFLIFGAIGCFWMVAVYADRLLPEAASEHGVVTDTLFNTTLFFTGIVFIITQILLFFFSFKYRETEHSKAFYFPHSNKLEVIWTLVPTVVLTILVVMGMRAWFDIFGPVPENANVVEVTAKQFNWMVRYPGLDNSFGSRSMDNVNPSNELGIDWTDPNSHDDIMASEIYMVANKPVQFKLGAQDVLHSFYLPHFRVKMDCVPGIPTSFWFTPTITTKEMREKLGNPDFNYELACAEMCGRAHFNMRFVVVVVEEDEYNDWLASQKPFYEIAVKPGATAASERESKEQYTALIEEETSEKTANL